MDDKQQPGWAERARYLFDKSMSAGTVALIGWLAVMSLAIIIVASAFVVITGIAPEGSERPHDFVETGWESLMRTLDSGTVGGDNGWPYRIVMLIVTIAGIFIFSALISVLSSGLEAKISELRKGRSKVLEQGHTIILNWSPSLVDILSELELANTDVKKASRVVILAARDKVEMEDEIAAKAPKLKGVEVICRSGDPCDLNDLAIVNPGVAKSIIVLAPDGEDPDAQVIKTILAVVNGPDRGTKPMQVVAEIREARNIELARTVGGAEVQIVLADDLISRILVQSTRQAGLSGVFAELLSFEGNEIYTHKVDGLAGLTFGDALLAFEEGALLGLADETTVRLNPEMDTVIGPDDKAVVVALDRTSIRVRKSREAIDTRVIRTQTPTTQTPKRILMLGWNRRGPAIAYELSRYTLPGSSMVVVADAPQFESEVAKIEGQFANLAVTTQVKDTTREATLKPLDVTGFDHVIVLGYTDNMAAQSADTRTLVTLLQLRKLADAAGRPVNVVSEMLDARNRALAEVTRADDFVVSNQLVSLMLAQASENPYISAIFADLLDEEGTEVYVRPITDYVAIDTPVSFYTIIEAARQRGEVAFGHRIGLDVGGDKHKSGVVVNPPRHEVRRYAASDAVVVLARG